METRSSRVASAWRSRSRLTATRPSYRLTSQSVTDRRSVRGGGDRNAREVARPAARSVDRRRRRWRRCRPASGAIDGFPRFGTHLARPAPVVPADPVITVRGAVTEAFDVPLATLADPSEASAHRRLPLRGGLVGHRPALGGGPVRGLLSHRHRTGARARRGDHPRGVPRPRRLPVGRLDRGRAGGWRAHRRPSRWPPARRRSRRAGATGQPRPVRLRQHQAPLPHRGPHRRAEADARRPASAPGCSVLTRGRGSRRRNVTASLPGWLVRPFYRALKAPLLRLCARGGAVHDEDSERRPRGSPLAHPRDRARLHGGGRLGPPGPR